jgi:hypothetical protein
VERASSGSIPLELALDVPRRARHLEIVDAPNQRLH